MTKRTATAKKSKARKVAKKAHGRPSKRTPGNEELILTGLRAGLFLTEACLLVDVHPTTVRDWANADPEFSLRLARAREDGELAVEASIQRIADTPLLGAIEKHELRRTGEVKEDGTEVTALVCTERRVVDNVERAKLMADTRWKRLRVTNPGRYSDKVEVNGTITLEQLVAESMRTGKDKAA